MWESENGGDAGAGWMLLGIACAAVSPFAVGGLEGGGGRVCVGMRPFVVMHVRCSSMCFVAHIRLECSSVCTRQGGHGRLSTESSRLSAFLQDALMLFCRKMGESTRNTIPKGGRWNKNEKCIAEVLWGQR